MDSLQRIKTNVHNTVGIIPLAGADGNLNMPWSDSLMPLSSTLLAVERSVMECAYAGCKSIWIVCDPTEQPLIRKRVGEWIYDPAHFKQVVRSNDYRVQIPIYYISVCLRAYKEQDSLPMVILDATKTIYKCCSSLSDWTIPKTYYVSFPLGICPYYELRAIREEVAEKNVLLSFGGKTVLDGEYLGFSFTQQACASAIGNIKRIQFNYLVREKDPLTKLFVKTETNKEDKSQTSAKQKIDYKKLTIQDVFKNILEKQSVIETVTWYYNISSWEGYRNYLSDVHLGTIKSLKKPGSFKYHEWNDLPDINEVFDTGEEKQND